MFKSKECVGHLVGGAVIGVAVGMLMQKILSPRSTQQPSDSADAVTLVCCKKLMKRSRSNELQVPSNHRKNRSNDRRHCRSKSASRSKPVENECNYLSVTRNSHHKLKLSVSESDLRSSFTEKSETSRHFELSTSATKTDEKSGEYFLKESTDYLPLESKVQKKSCEKIENDFNCDMSPETSATMSSEYVPLELKNRSEEAESTILMPDINNRKFDFIPSESIDEHNLNTSTDYSNLESKIPKNSSAELGTDFMSTEYMLLELKKKSENSEPTVLISDVNNRKFDIIPSETIGEYFSNTSTDCSPLESKIQKKVFDKIEADFTSTEYIPLELTKKSVESGVLIRDINSRESDFISVETTDCSIIARCGTDEHSSNSKFYRESIGSVSTEHPMPYEVKSASKNSAPLLSDVNRESSAMFREYVSSSIDNLSGNETANWSINATCDTVDKDFDFTSYSENRSESIVELFDGISDTQEFVTLPMFVESKRLSSTEFHENRSE